jgi:hypothetical protein
MSIFDRGIRGNVQTPFTVLDASTTAYANPRLVGNWSGNVALALDYLLDAVYPNYKGTVATFGDLPVSPTANDFYIVQDDGDGNSAGYVYSDIGGVTQWIKRYDVDWSYEQILTDTINRTSFMYAAKYGVTDKDATGVAITGTYAGQRVYGGDQTSQNFTLTANSHDLTGFVQTDNTFRPTSSNALDLGTASFKWRTGIFGTSVQAGTATLASGSLTDSSGSLSFGSTALATTGTLASGTHTIGNLVLASASITHTSGTLSFGSTNLSTSGTLTAAASSVLADITFTNGTFNTASSAFSFSSKNVGSIGTLTSSKVVTDEADIQSLVLSGQTLKTNLDATALILQAGSGGNSTTVQLNSAVQANFNLTVTGTLTVNGSSTHAFTGPVQVGTALKLSTATGNGKVESLAGDLLLNPFSSQVKVTGKIVPEADNTRDLGATALRFKDAYLSGSISDGTNSIAMATLLSLRDITVGVGSNMSIFWNGSKFVASSADTEVDHTTISNLTTGDAGHTQFAMLVGRSGGQSISGGTAASENLTLDSTFHATKGFVLTSSDFAPSADASYSGGWTGKSLGGASRNFNNMYSKGIHYGLRFDQYAGSGTYPSNSGQNVGRVIWDTSLNQLLVDNGTTWSKVGQQKWSSDTVWDGSTTSKTVDVSAIISDARTAIWQLCDNTNAYERMFVKITCTQTIVTITVNPALPAGSYRLIGLN